MTDYDSNELSVLDDEDQKRSLIARPQASVLPPVAVRPLGIQPQTAQAGTGSTEDLEQKAAKIPAQMGTSLRTAAQPDTPPPLQQRIGQEQNELTRLQSTGSGISQIKNPWAKGGARALNIAGEIGSAIIPQIGTALRAIPGTEEHHQRLIGQQENALGADTQNAAQQAATEHTQAETEAIPENEELKREKENEAEDKNKNVLNEQYRKLGLKIDPATNQPVAIPYEEMSQQEQAAHDLKVSQGEAADARAQLDQLKADPTSPLYQAQLQRLKISEQNARNAAARIGLSGAQFQNKLQEQELVKPSGQTQSRGSAAQTALDTLPDTIALIKKNAGTMGPLMGRIAKGEIAIGDVDPETAKVYTALKSLYALQPAVHGFRSAEFVKDFETAVGNIERNPEGVIGGLEGLKPTLENVAKEGKTYHNRIVEGRDTGNKNGASPKDLGPAPAGKAEGATGALPDGTKVVVKDGRLVAQ